MTDITLHVNGRDQAVSLSDPETPLLYVLRDDLGLHGPKFGCGLGQCGSCTVMVVGQAVRSCTTKTASVAGRKITTLEGLGSPETPSKVQAAFIAEAAAQCGYCTNGMIMSATALLSPQSPSQRIRHSHRPGGQSVPLRQSCAGYCGGAACCEGGLR